MARELGDAHCRSWGARFLVPSPGNANCPRCPKAQPPPRTPARSWRARVSAVTSPHPAPKCEPAAAGPARGKVAPGAGTGVVPSPAAPGSVGERSPLGRLRPSLALSGREGGERRGRGNLQAAPRSSARAPVAGEKSAPGPAPSPRAQRPLLVTPRSYAETPPGPKRRAAAKDVLNAILSGKKKEAIPIEKRAVCVAGHSEM